MFLRWALGILAIGLMTTTVYRPHILQGEAGSAVFPPRRIASLSLATDEILLALVPAERIAALTYLADDPRFSNVVVEARTVRHRVRANAEQVIALQPDLILLAAYTSAATKDLLYQAGVALFEFHLYDSLDGIQQNILAVGQAVGEEEHARDLVEEMDRQLETLKVRLAGVSRLRVLYYAAGGFTAGSGTTMDDLITRAGGRNLATEAGIQQFKKISLETLVALNPEAILVSGEPEQEGLRELLMADPALQGVQAIRAGRVHVIPLPYVSSLSHHIIKGVEIMAYVLHPEAFAGAFAEAFATAGG
jgi:iron complex transport system substrate-binding protein